MSFLVVEVVINGDVKLLKFNIGVFINFKYDFWVSEIIFSVDSVKFGEDLKFGEVIVVIWSIGICGYVYGEFCI